MTNSKAAKRYRWTTIVYLLAVFTLCVLNFGSVSIGPEEFIGIRIDHVAHFIMFTPMPFLFFGIYYSSASAVSAGRLVLICLMSFFIASFTEILQLYVIPWRSGEWFDLVADAAGILFGCLLTSLFFFIFIRHKNNLML